MWQSAAGVDGKFDSNKKSVGNFNLIYRVDIIDNCENLKNSVSLTHEISRIPGHVFHQTFIKFDTYIARQLISNYVKVNFPAIINL